MPCRYGSAAAPCRKRNTRRKEMARKPAPAEGDRRSHILAAALEIFSERGLEGATNTAIAARAEVTHGLIYFYFPSKEDLFYAAVEYQADLVFAQLDLASERA